MKKLLFLIVVLFSFNSFSQENAFNEYSYSQLFEMIEAEKDSVFTLKDALIKYNLKTDSLFMVDMELRGGRIFKPKRKKTLVIDKALVLENVHFQNHIFNNKDNNAGYLVNIHFKKSVQIKGTAAISILNCQFDKELNIGGSGEVCQTLKTVAEKYNVIDKIDIEGSTFNKGLSIFFNCNFVSSNPNTYIAIGKNDFYPNPKSAESLRLVGRNFGRFGVYNNTFHKNAIVDISNGNDPLRITNNSFGNSVVAIGSYTKEAFEIRDNTFDNRVFISLPELDKKDEFDLKQFKKTIISVDSYAFYYRTLVDSLIRTGYNRPALSDSLQENYLNHVRYTNQQVFDEESGLLGQLFDFYQTKHNKASANKMYVQLKDLETERLAHLFRENPNFDTFFTLKINQFLKVFSEYGTRPSKAIIFSMYVILLFAFIYLMFPNSWDEHGRKRIMDRYAFFFTYMNKKAGIHEVYLDNQKEDLLEFDEFKTLVEQQGKTVPKFFTTTALPLYKWAISGTKLSASFLKRIDIMKGTWNELPAHKRFWKSILLVGAFLIAVLYDIFIKMLNALMLSINTFTTLGFGEIPIKGLPRYLAIIQGFIGWFMLTIFSVSLISQLLN